MAALVGVGEKSRNKKTTTSQTHKLIAIACSLVVGSRLTVFRGASEGDGNQAVPLLWHTAESY